VGLFGDIKAAYIRKQLKALPNPEEIETMADEQVKKNGVPPWLANVAAAAAGVIVLAVQDVASGGNFSDLISNPKKLVAAVVAAVLFRIGHSLTPPAKA